jgi:asparagine synthase (glutamine-hydrolysing)
VLNLGGALGKCVVAGDRSITVGVDGYIANLAELTVELGCETNVDLVRVLATAYVRWKEGFFPKLVGSFALFVYDEAGKALYLARDTVGTVPLYWAQKGEGTLAFASLPIAVCRGINLPIALSVRGVKREFLGLEAVAPESLFEGVRTVEPGCVLSIIDGKIANVRYRTLEQLTIRGVTDDELVDVMREGIVEGVDWYVGRPDAKVGLAFSGGLDSSALLGAACLDPVQKARVCAVTAVVSGRAEADLKYAESVVKHCNVRWDCFRSTAQPVPDGVLKYTANPIRVADLCVGAEIFSRVQTGGANTVITGASGDIIGGGGWGWRLAMLRDGLFRTFVAELREDGLKGPRLVRSIAGAVARLAWREAKGSRLVRDKDAKFESTLLDLVGATGDERHALAEELWRKNYRLSVPPRDLVRWVAWIMGAFVVQEFEAFSLLGRVLGMEVGSPLCHPKVVSAGLSLPWSLRRRGGVSRVALREAARPWLPREVLARRPLVEFSDHVLPVWKQSIRDYRTKETLRHTADFFDLGVWKALSGAEERLPSHVVCNLYEVTVLERWLGLNITGAVGIEYGASHGIV